MRNRNTLIAVRFKTENGKPGSAYAMDYCLCKDGSNRISGCIEFSPRRSDSPCIKPPFPEIFQKWYGETFEKWDLPKGRLPVVIGWGMRDREIFDYLLEDDDINLITQAISYLDVKAYALGCKRVKGIRASDGWKRVASKFELLDPQYGDMEEPTPRAIIEMYFAIEGSGHVSVIKKAFKDVAKVIMADGVVTTDEAKLLRSFVSVLLDDQTQYDGLSSELNDILSDNVVDKDESDRLMQLLKKMLSDMDDGDVAL